MNTTQFFDGEFAFLPFRASLDGHDIPMHPTGNDFQLASVSVHGDYGTWERAAGIWALEAIRERIARPACKFDGETLHAINERVAERLYKEARDNA